MITQAGVGRLDQDAAIVAHAKRKGNTHRFRIQITTKGGALAVVQRSIDNVLAGVARYPVLQEVVWIEIITEVADEVAVLQTLYRNAVIPVPPYFLPPDYLPPRDTRLKAGALEYMVEQHRANPTDSYVPTTTKNPSSLPTTWHSWCIA